MFLPDTDLADKLQENTLDLFTFLSREAEKTQCRSESPRLLPAEKTLACCGSLLSNCRGGGLHFHCCGSYSSFSHAFVCHSIISKARCNSTHAGFALPSLGLCGNARRAGGAVAVFRFAD
ncbi:hypothetical protein CRENBAI_007261 [Crenichthys baileyi]|uniref:Uncharacterized protein n=1 Tax=Crenichthys baileyi TaxID=28760 RepID=A0AAV9RG34_9TELE